MVKMEMASLRHADSHAVGAVVLLGLVGGEEKVGLHAGSPAAVLSGTVH